MSFKFQDYFKAAFRLWFLFIDQYIFDDTIL